MQAQTFTAGITGLLDHVRLAAYRNTNTGSVTFSIVNTVGGLPSLASGDLLGSVTQTVSGTHADNWVTVDFSGEGIALVDGSMYAIVLGARSGLYHRTIIWDAYDPGEYYTYNGSTWSAFSTATDAKFETYMSPAPSVPAPGALVLALSGVGLLGARRLRRKQD